jgi:hypothetical protein
MKKKSSRAGSKPSASLPVADVIQFEALARKRLSQMAYDYIRSGGAGEITMRENRLAFERLALSPRVLVDVSEINTRISLFGAELESPILLAPSPISGCFILKVNWQQRAPPMPQARFSSSAHLLPPPLLKSHSRPASQYGFSFMRNATGDLRATWWSAPSPRAAKLFASPWTRLCSGAATDRSSSRLLQESIVLNCTGWLKRSKLQVVKREGPASTICFLIPHSVGAMLSGCARFLAFHCS